MFYAAVIIWVFLLVVALAALSVYYLIYTIRINRRVCGGIHGGRRMPDFPKTAMAALVLLLFAIGIVNIFAPGRPVAPGRNDFAVIDTSDYSYMAYSSSYNLEDASYARMFSEKENSGYTRKVTTDGDFRFTVFTSTAPPDSFHPDFLCYVAYIGDGAEMLSWNAQYMEAGTGRKGGISAEADVTGHSWLFVGNYDQECRFVLTAGAYDRAAYENYSGNQDGEAQMESFATSVASVVIGGE